MLTVSPIFLQVCMIEAFFLYLKNSETDRRRDVYVVNLSLHYNCNSVECSNLVVAYDLASHASY